MTDERIERAAIRHRGHVYSLPRPSRHHDVIRAMTEAGLGPQCHRHQGFVTSEGRFVDRREALKIAREAAQIVAKTEPANRLFSEDLW